jgi:RES domain-containing protein
MVCRFKGPLRAYRIADRRYPIFDGTGAALHGARWNSPGRRVIYAAASFAGAMLERLAQTGTGTMPKNQYAVVIDVPAEVEIEEVEPADVPGRDLPDQRTSRAYGDAWLTERIREIQRATAERLGTVEAQIFEPQILMLDDPDLVDGTIRYIRENHLAATRAFELRILEIQSAWSRSGSISRSRWSWQSWGSLSSNWSANTAPRASRCGSTNSVSVSMYLAVLYSSRWSRSGRNQPALCKPHCSSVAAPLKPNHTTRYPPTNAVVRRKVPAAPLRSLPSAAYESTIGVAEGVIIATIITLHITNTSASSVARQPCAAGNPISIP